MFRLVSTRRDDFLGVAGPSNKMPKLCKIVLRESTMCLALILKGRGRGNMTGKAQ